MIIRKQITFLDYADIPKEGRRYCFVSDVHLGHDRTPTWYTIDTLNANITNATFMATIDALFFPGDLFDKLLHNNANAMDDIHEWIENLLRLSKRTNTPIRILEGTPSHDWKQSSIISHLNEIYKINADVLYYQELTAVYDETLNITIGYVPDEWRESCDQTYIEFTDILKTKGYDSVDLIVMHGMFEFQIPKAAAKSISHFKEADWEPLANTAIVIGHDHRYKHSGKITVPSSWQRLAHNEEDEKGCLVIQVANRIVDIYHLMNPSSMLYLTVDGVDKTDTEVIALAEATLHRFGELPEPRGRMKVKYNREYDISTKLSQWKSAFEHVIVEGAGERITEDTESTIDGNFKLESNAINITPDNIDGMIHRTLESSDSDMNAIDEEIALIKSRLVGK